jgi:hypothetical protein
VTAAALQARPDCARATVTDHGDGVVDLAFDAEDWRGLDAALPVPPEEAGDKLSERVAEIPLAEWNAILAARSSTKTALVDAIGRATVTTTTRG